MAARGWGSQAAIGLLASNVLGELGHVRGC